MRQLTARIVVTCGVMLTAAMAQTTGKGFPAGVFSAKTVAVVNDTKTPAVEKGADDALKNWGQFKLVDDPQLADVTLRFDKTREHEGHDTQKTDATGKPTDYGYSMSFGSKIHMQAYLKDSDTPFYSTQTEDGKAKAGTTCVNDFHTAFRAAMQQQKQP